MTERNDYYDYVYIDVFDLYAEILGRLFQMDDKDRQKMMQAIQDKIDLNLQEIDAAMDEWTDKKIDVTEYRAVKNRYGKLNTTLMLDKAQLQGFANDGKLLKAWERLM